MTSEETITFNQAKFDRIALLLGWKIHPSGVMHWGTYFYGEGDRRYSVHTHGDHYTVKGELPDTFVALGCSTYDLHLEQTEARISTAKTAEQIAKEIKRRVCERYEEAYIVMVERIESVTKYNAAVKVQAEFLAECLAGKARGIDDPHLNVTVSKTFNLGSTRIEATVYKDSCNWKLSIPHDLSRKIAKTIAEHYAARWPKEKTK